MVIKAFAIFDSKAGAFMPPFFMNATGQAVRAFADLAGDREHPVGKHPGDYRLAQVGTYEDSSGRLEGMDKVEWLGYASEYVNVKEN